MLNAVITKFMLKSAAQLITSDTAIKKGVVKIDQLLNRHLGRVLEIRKGISVKNSSLVTDELTKHIPTLRWHVKSKVANLRSELKEILWEIAAEHEKERFETLRKDFEKINGVSKFHLERGTAILENERQMFISYHSLFFACKACSEVNKSMLGQIENEKFSENKGRIEIDLLLKNAIFVFEITSLIVDMIQQFQLNGLKEFQLLQNTVFKELAEAEINSQKNVMQANHPSIPTFQKDDTVLRHNNLKESAKLVRAQWQHFETRIKSMQQNAGELSQRIPSLILTRDNAKVQLDFLELVAVTQMMNQNINAIDGLANLELTLAPLSPYDVCRLIGSDTAFIASSNPLSESTGG
jgi:rubrerythrin/cell fate (sporulation/competence/biofilm development) regulator YmcA (YheA/YmcA/DUF963 family)